MQDRLEQVNNFSEHTFDPIEHFSRDRFYFIRTWLNKFERNKLEYYSVLFGISGISFIVLGLCILIIILTINENHIIQQLDCTILNITYTHVKLCQSYRCQNFNYCIPYICMIVFVRYYHANNPYESQLYSLNHYSNFSCSYEPLSCVSLPRIHFEQIEFLKTYAFNLLQSTPCCFDSLTEKPIVCPTYHKFSQYSLTILLIIICFLIGLISIIIGILTQLHLNNYFKSQQSHSDNFFETILNIPPSNENIRSSRDRLSPVNYEILTQTISQHNTPSVTKNDLNTNLLLFDINEENKIFQNESLKSNFYERIQNEIIRQYQLNDEEIKTKLKEIESKFQQEHHINLPKNSVERIKYLLKTIDNLAIYFPTICKAISHSYLSTSSSLDQQSIPLSVSYPHSHFFK